MAVFALVERLAHLIEKEVNLHLESKKEVENLTGKLKKVQEVLKDAERTGVTDSKVKNWLKELQDVSYEMDDALDEWQTANLQLQIEGSEEVSDPWEKVISFIQSTCLCFKHVVGRREINLNIKGLIGKLDSIVQGKDEFGFLPSVGHNLQEFTGIESTSLVDSANVHGRDIDKENLIQNLLSEGGSGVQIVSIVGTGGVGKTTLAQLAYNDPKVKEHFELKTWICVSDPFDEKKIAKSVLEAIGESSSNISNLEMLLQHVKNSISKKRFLIVLDDVWIEDRKKWEPLKNSLQGAPGSRILVTTRSDRVARAIGTDTWQRLDQLSDEDCWSLLSKIAFVGKSKEERVKLEDIGKKIALNCKGLPLAAKTMGSLLCFKDTVGLWLNVLKSPLWQLEEVTVELFPHLYLSYNDLSPVLKRCFLSCVIYPKDTSIRLDKLIRIWMAHGYLGTSGDVDRMQMMGLEFFKNLEMRSFFQELKNDENDESKISCKMHDIMHDFVTYLSKDEYCLILDDGVGNKNCDIGKVRTFCARDVFQEGGLPLNLFSRLKCVRVLIASDCDLQELPQEIGKLIHLRYLDLSSNPIRELPETLCDLYNLQTLDLQYCYSLSALPQGIFKLINLRHLLFEVGRMKSIPQGLERLTGLRMLSSFKAGRGSSKLGYLKELNQLRGSLELVLGDLTELEDLIDTEKAELKNKIYIQNLEFIFEREVRVDVMQALQPPPNLHCLRMNRYRGTQFPEWITTSLNYLRVLRFSSFKNCSSLPPLGKLPMLEELEILAMYSMKCVGNEFLGIVETIQILPNAGPAFPKLRRLSFTNCRNWEKWEDITGDEKDHLLIMPCLRDLEIAYCYELKALPHCLLRMASSLEYLTVKDSSCLASLYGERTGDEWDKISHIPHITIGSLEHTKRYIETVKEQIRVLNDLMERMSLGDLLKRHYEEEEEQIRFLNDLKERMSLEDLKKRYIETMEEQIRFLNDLIERLRLEDLDKRYIETLEKQIRLLNDLIERMSLEDIEKRYNEIVEEQIRFLNDLIERMSLEDLEKRYIETVEEEIRFLNDLIERKSLEDLEKRHPEEAEEQMRFLNDLTNRKSLEDLEKRHHEEAEEQIRFLINVLKERKSLGDISKRDHEEAEEQIRIIINDIKELKSLADIRKRHHEEAEEKVRFLLNDLKERKCLEYIRKRHHEEAEEKVRFLLNDLKERKSSEDIRKRHHEEAEEYIRFLNDLRERKRLLKSP